MTNVSKRKSSSHDIYLTDWRLLNETLSRAVTPYKKVLKREQLKRWNYKTPFSKWHFPRSPGLKGKHIRKAVVTTPQ